MRWALHTVCADAKVADFVVSADQHINVYERIKEEMALGDGEVVGESAPHQKESLGELMQRWTKNWVEMTKRIPTEEEAASAAQVILGMCQGDCQDLSSLMAGQDPSMYPTPDQGVTQPVDQSTNQTSDLQPNDVAAAENALTFPQTQTDSVSVPIA